MAAAKKTTSAKKKVPAKKVATRSPIPTKGRKSAQEKTKKTVTLSKVKKLVKPVKKITKKVEAPAKKITKKIVAASVKKQSSKVVKKITTIVKKAVKKPAKTQKKAAIVLKKSSTKQPFANKLTVATKPKALLKKGIAKPSLAKKTSSPMPVRKPLKSAAPTRALNPKRPAVKALSPQLPVPFRKKDTAPQVSYTKTQPKDTQNPVLSPEKTAILLKARHKPSVLAGKNRSRKHTPVFFSIEEVLSVIKNRPADQHEPHAEPAQKFTKTTANPTLKPTVVPPAQNKVSVHKAASLADILGFNPKEEKKHRWHEYDESKIEKRFFPFYKNLLKLREHVHAGLSLHAQDSLKRSNKDDSGDLSGYGQHIADAGTDNFDRDFALGLVSSEQDLLYEIDEAIHRVLDGTYGICEVTNVPINRERLMAVPFTRYSLEGQRQQEKNKRRTAVQRGGIFSETDFDASASQYEESNEE